MSTKLKQCKDMENLEVRTKKCSKCGRELPVSEFYAKKYAPDGLQAWCKECQKTANYKRFASKAWNARNEKLRKSIIER